MTESVASLTPEERALSADWARDRLRRMKESKRPKASTVYGPSSMRAPTYEEQMFQSASLPTSQPEIAAGQFRDSTRRLKEGVQGIRGQGPQADEVAARSARYGALRGLRQVRGQSGSSKDQAHDAATEAASMAARQGYTRIWDGVQGALGSLALAFYGVLAIFMVVPVAGVFLLRLFGGHAMGGMGTFSFRGVSVPRVPGYSILTIPMHLLNLLLVVAVAAIWLGSIVIVMNIIFSTIDAWCTPFGWLIKLFGNEICS